MLFKHFGKEVSMLSLEWSCTGPIVMVNEAKLSEATKALQKLVAYDVGESDPCY